MQKTIYISDKDKKIFQEAQQQNKSLSAVIAEALRLYLKAKEAQNVK